MPPALPPLAKSFSGLVYFFFHQEFCAVCKIGESIFLLQQFAVIIPVPAHFLASADMCNAKNKTTVEKADH